MKIESLSENKKIRGEWGFKENEAKEKDGDY